MPRPTSSSRGPAPAPPARSDEPALEWTLDVRLLTNRHMLAAFAKVVFGSIALCIALVGGLLAAHGEWRAAAGIAELFAATGAGMAVLFVLVILWPFRNRMRMRFRIDDEGVRIDLGDRIARVGNRASFWAGVALGSGMAAGAGLLARTQESQTFAWSGAFRPVVEPATRSIALRNGWRTLARIWCTPEGFDVAVARVAREVERHGTAARCAKRTPLPRYLARTALVIVACVPVFAAASEARVESLWPLLLLCFALATVWFVRPLAWVVLFAQAAICALIAADAVSTRRAFFGGTPRPRYELFSGDDWALLALALAGMAVLAWIAVQTLRGRLVPVLAADLSDAGETSG